VRVFHTLFTGLYTVELASPEWEGKILGLDDACRAGHVHIVGDGKMEKTQEREVPILVSKYDVKDEVQSGLIRARIYASNPPSSIPPRTLRDVAKNPSI
jgi:hypothetical protein